MTSILHSAGSHEELLQPGTTHPHYDFTSIFNGDEKPSRRREKKRLALLRNIDARLEDILEDGETVQMVSHGLENSVVEQMFAGWAAYYLNLTAFVLTDRRLLLLQITRRRKPSVFIKQYALGAIRSVKFTWSRALKVTSSDGKTKTFARLPGKDGKRLAALLNDALPQAEKRTHGREHLCPNCFGPMQSVPVECSECGQPFKSRRRAAALSLVFPGLGDVYLGHYGFAVMEMLVGTWFWAVIVIGLMDPASQPVYTLGEAILAAGMILVPFIHLPDAVVTWLIAGKGLTPAGKPVVTQVQAPTGAHQWGK